MDKPGKLYLFPTQLGDTDFNNILPSFNLELIAGIKFFVVEDIRSARRFLKKCNSAIEIDSLTFFVLNQHTTPEETTTFIAPLKAGKDMGLLSEAGCPAIADPGAEVVALAQENHIQVVPLIGPSSIILSLMASGFNGQSFAFNGYLPIQQAERTKTLKKHESRIYAEGQTQIYIETPYRNMKILQDFIEICQPHTRLCIAVDITLTTEFIQTRALKDWKNNIPELSKRPCIFLLYRS